MAVNSNTLGKQTVRQLFDAFHLDFRRTTNSNAAAFELLEPETAHNRIPKYSEYHIPLYTANPKPENLAAVLGTEKVFKGTVSDFLLQKEVPNFTSIWLDFMGAGESVFSDIKTFLDKPNALSPQGAVLAITFGPRWQNIIPYTEYAPILNTAGISFLPYITEKNTQNGHREKLVSLSAWLMEAAPNYTIKPVSFIYYMGEGYMYFVMFEITPKATATPTFIFPELKIFPRTKTSKFFTFSTPEVVSFYKLLLQENPSLSKFYDLLKESFKITPSVLPNTSSILNPLAKLTAHNGKLKTISSELARLQKLRNDRLTECQKNRKGKNIKSC